MASETVSRSANTFEAGVMSRLGSLLEVVAFADSATSTNVDGASAVVSGNGADGSGCRIGSSATEARLSFLAFFLLFLEVVSSACFCSAVDATTSDCVTMASSWSLGTGVGSSGVLAMTCSAGDVVGGTSS